VATEVLGADSGIIYYDASNLSRARESKRTYDLTRRE
jgi:hypothetical protein